MYVVARDRGIYINKYIYIYMMNFCPTKNAIQTERKEKQNKNATQSIVYTDLKEKRKKIDTAHESI